jgi:hypothetical protein
MAWTLNFGTEEKQEIAPQINYSFFLEYVKKEKK